jgi:hypothetical protein
VSGSLGGGQREWLSYERRWQVDAARVANSFVSRAGGGRQRWPGFLRHADQPAGEGCYDPMSSTAFPPAAPSDDAWCGQRGRALGFFFAGSLGFLPLHAGGL